MSGATPMPMDGGAEDAFPAPRSVSDSRSEGRRVLHALGSGPVALESCPDDELVRRSAAGEREAFGVLVERHHRTLSAVLYQRFGSRAPVEDLVQETFVKVLQNLDRFRGGSSFLTWATSIALNLGIDRGRKSTRRRRLAPPADVEPDEIARSPGPHVAELRDEVERARAALDELPDAQRLAVTLRVVEDQDYGEVARRLGVPVPRVRTWVSRGLAKLRTRLVREED